MKRIIQSHYRDPLDLIWLECASQIGMTVTRSLEVYASWDGEGTLTLSAAEDMDPDDCLAQMIFHEICHALVEGPGSWKKPDWGLENIDDRDIVREHACNRLQAALAGRYGLREFLAVTTDWRPYYDALPPDPLAPGEDPAIDLALAAWPAALRGSWSQPLDQALRATAALAAVLKPLAPPGSLWALARDMHPAGFPAGDPGETCGGCAWKAGSRCLQLGAHRRKTLRVRPEWPACERWEPPLTPESCSACGACCREAFHQVPLSRREPLHQLKPEWVARDEHGAHLPRPGGRCVALTPGLPYRCSVYDARPRSCREFAVGGESCLEARRRVGLSRRG